MRHGHIFINLFYAANLNSFIHAILCVQCAACSLRVGHEDGWKKEFARWCSAFNAYTQEYNKWLCLKVSLSPLRGFNKTIWTQWSVVIALVACDYSSHSQLAFSYTRNSKLDNKTTSHGLYRRLTAEYELSNTTRSTVSPSFRNNTWQIYTSIHTSSRHIDGKTRHGKSPCRRRAVRRNAVCMTGRVPVIINKERFILMYLITEWKEQQT